MQIELTAKQANLSADCAIAVGRYDYSRPEKFLNDVYKFEVNEFGDVFMANGEEPNFAAQQTVLELSGIKYVNRYAR